MKRRHRIVHVTQSLEMGGLEKLLVEFARHADRRRFELHFVSLSERGLLADEIESLGWPVTALHLASGFRPALFLKLQRFLRLLRADVVHTHDERPHIYGAIAGRLACIPHIVHTRHRGQNLVVSTRQKLLLRFVATLTDRFICVSHDSAGLAEAQGVSRRQLVVIWNGIDTTRFQPHTPVPHGTLVTVARLSPEKDIQTAIRAMALLKDTAPAMHLEIAGDGPCMTDLRELVKNLDVEKQVHLLGQVRNIPALLAHASLFLLPSRTEGISLTLLEAMASGLPVVTTRVGGNPEVVAEGITGWLVPPGDPSALADKLLQVWRDPAAAASLGKAGRARVETHFDIRHMMAQMEQLYLGYSSLQSPPPISRQ